ncbi:hypothetical protein RZ573_004502 [Klebsiella variicola]|nr:hypothetical protein [Klebsiella variicola]
MNIETVNELIASMESAGELSIREQKFLKMAKAFKQLAAENASLKKSKPSLKAMMSALDTFYADEDVPESAMLIAFNILRGDIETPATDAYLAGIKADGVEEFAAYQSAVTEEWACKEGHSSLLKVAESAELFAQQLREGADK